MHYLFRFKSCTPDIDLTGNSETVDGGAREDALDDEEDLKNSIGEIWGVDLCSMEINTLEEMESYLLSKLLDALRYYRVCSYFYNLNLSEAIGCR